MGRISNNFTNQTGESLPQTMGSGAPPPPRINSTGTMTSIQERLRNSRTPQ